MEWKVLNRLVLLSLSSFFKVSGICPTHRFGTSRDRRKLVVLFTRDKMEIVKLAASSIFRTIGSTKKVLWDEVSALNTQWWRLGAARGSDRNCMVRVGDGRHY